MDNSQIIYKNGVILETTHEELMDLTCPLVFPEININFPTGIKIKGGNSRCVLGRDSTIYHDTLYCKKQNVVVCIIEWIFPLIELYLLSLWAR